MCKGTPGEYREGIGHCSPYGFLGLNLENQTWRQVSYPLAHLVSPL